MDGTPAQAGRLALQQTARRILEMRYYFDIRDGADVSIDHGGVELENDRAAKIQATLALTEMARDNLPAEGNERRLLIHVRTDDGPRFDVRLDYEVQMSGQGPKG